MFDIAEGNKQQTYRTEDAMEARRTKFGGKCYLTVMLFLYLLVD